MHDIVDIVSEYGIEIYIQKQHENDFELFVYDNDVRFYSRKFTKKEIEELANRMNEFLKNS